MRRVAVLVSVLVMSSSLVGCIGGGSYRFRPAPTDRVATAPAAPNAG